MTRDEIIKRIDELEDMMFYESMSEYMNWKNYTALRNERDELKKQLEEL
jgi:hypothetical protein